MKPAGRTFSPARLRDASAGFLAHDTACPKKRVPPILRSAAACRFMRPPPAMAAPASAGRWAPSRQPNRRLKDGTGTWICDEDRDRRIRRHARDDEPQEADPHPAQPGEGERRAARLPGLHRGPRGDRRWLEPGRQGEACFTIPPTEPSKPCPKQGGTGSLRLRASCNRVRGHGSDRRHRRNGGPAPSAPRRR